ncbi:hypothetical protein C4585_02220 [Candidatus Parcubacteria bacterium]|nr:MAG: hypothetical protein C4585_02220 [Candidatus Parcubacteria bacterium]
MNEGTEEQRDRIIQKLEMLNENVERQMSVWYTFRNSVIYGVGFIVGSTIFTALVVSFGLTLFGDTIFGDVVAWIVAR